MVYRVPAMRILATTAESAFHFSTVTSASAPMVITVCIANTVSFFPQFHYAHSTSAYISFYISFYFSTLEIYLFIIYLYMITIVKFMPAMYIYLDIFSILIRARIHFTLLIINYNTML